MAPVGLSRRGVRRSSQHLHGIAVTGRTAHGTTTGHAASGAPIATAGERCGTWSRWHRRCQLRSGPKCLTSAHFGTHDSGCSLVDAPRPGGGHTAVTGHYGPVLADPTAGQFGPRHATEQREDGMMQGRQRPFSSGTESAREYPTSTPDFDSRARRGRGRPHTLRVLSSWYRSHSLVLQLPAG